MNATIASAIATRTVIEFDYNNEHRWAEPYAHGESNVGNELTRAFQIGGGSESGETSGWKLFNVAKISNLRLTPQTFADNRPGYNRNDPALVITYSCV